MPFLEKLFECVDCGELLTTDTDTGELMACESCGSKRSRAITDIAERLKFKIRPASVPGKPQLEVIIADDFHRESQEWRQLKMTVDRANNQYEKTVIDPDTDQVLYSHSEPLKEHTGRGSAKRNKPDGKEPH